jgi:hypothetical protein
MAETEVAAQMLENIWRVGRIRYLKDDPAGHRLRFFDELTYDKYLRAIHGEDPKFVTNRMSVNLAYTYAYRPDLVCTNCGREPRPDERTRKTWWGLLIGVPSEIHVLCTECGEDEHAAGIPVTTI